MTAPLVAVLGASGAQGGAVARAILEDPSRRFRVRAIVDRAGTCAARSLAHAGAEVVCTDVDDAAAVLAAMRGAYGAFCVTDYWPHRSPARELKHARAMADAAAQAGVKHIVWSTCEDTREFFGGGSRSYRVPPFDAKGEANRFFIGSGVPATMLYTPIAWDDLLESCLQPHGDAGVALMLPTGTVKLPGIDVDDIGLCTLSIFTRGAELAGKSIGIAGEHLSGVELAAELRHALNEPVAHVDLTPAEFRAGALAPAAELASIFEFVRSFERAYRDARSVACARELHPQTRTFAAWLAKDPSNRSISAPHEVALS